MSVSAVTRATNKRIKNHVGETPRISAKLGKALFVAVTVVPGALEPSDGDGTGPSAPFIAKAVSESVAKPTDAGE